MSYAENQHQQSSVGDVYVDFRQVYATLLDEWLGLPSDGALGGRFERLALLRDRV